jgi:glycosyltransferase involved in cell wall biosynthesis
MKVLHVPFCYFPDPVGGTEVFVEALARQQKDKGLQVAIAAPGAKRESYRHQDIPVCRFVVSGPVQDLSELYGKGIPKAAEAFDEILSTEKPDIVHLHSFTGGLSMGVVEKAQARKIPVVFTYHTPTVSCQRGTLLRDGKEICDGVLDVRKCTSCTLQGLGVHQVIGAALACMPVEFGRRIGGYGLSGGPWTALRMTNLLERRMETFKQFMEHVDRIVVPCDWAREVLVKNDVASEKISLSRLGLTRTAYRAATLKGKSPESAPLKVAYFGRLESAKGVDILIRAIIQNKDLSLRLDIYGIAQGGSKDPYFEHLRRLVGTDSRIQFKTPVPPEQVPFQLQAYDLLAVPSQGLETGPLVVLEAFAVRVPVLGSKLGGIAELVQSEVNGLLVEAQSVNAWATALSRVASQRELLSTWKRGIPEPRAMSDVTRDMDHLYEGLLCLR